jgi:hypothetical protein
LELEQLERSTTYLIFYKALANGYGYNCNHVTAESLLRILFSKKNINQQVGSVAHRIAKWWVCLVGVMVGLEATPTHPTSPVNKRTPVVFRPFRWVLTKNFSKFISKLFFL